MVKWEHKSDELKNCIQGIKHYELITERSSQGWELVSTIVVEVGSEKRLRFYWKREMKKGGNNE
jgi:hypothetical protein